MMSIAAHGLAIGILLSRAPLRASDATDSPKAAWFEVTRQAEPEPPEPAPPAPPPPTPPVPLERPRSARATATKSRSVSSPRVPSADERQGGLPDGEGTLLVGPAGDGLTSGSGDGAVQAAEPAAAASPATPEPRRERRPAQLSLWIDPKQFEHLALLRPGIAVLMAVPGFRDVLRGSSIRPFDDLERLRVSIRGADPEKLMVAGVHVGGENAVRDAARRVAAMRRQEPIWRGDSKLQATSWVDGTTADRGLAVRDGAFLIGARSSMPALLGSSSEDPVREASRLRKRVIILLTIDDAARYLPGASKCSLEAFRLSIAAQGDTQRISLRADYETSAAARAAAQCLRPVEGGSAPDSELLGWLARAQVLPDSSTTQLSTEVMNAQIQSLLDGLAWVLRSVGRT
jgi:hypothetical protein